MVKDNEILQAVRDHNTESLTKLLQKTKNGKKLLHSNKKPNVNYQDEEGMAALHQAALQGDTDCINILINNAAHQDIKDNKGMRPLHYAAWQGRMEPVAALLNSGASPTEPSNDGQTPLHFACHHGHMNVVRLLLKHGANPTIENLAFKTPFDLACEFGRYQVVDLLIGSTLCDSLLHNRTDLITDNKRSTPLHLAARGGFTDIIRLLLDASVDMNCQTHQGTALHEAALYGKIGAVKMLIEAGIDVNVPNSYEQTALDIVQKFTRKAGAKELKVLLQEASRAVCVRAVKSYSNSNDPQSLSFSAGEQVTVIDQKPNGMWRGFVTRDGRKSADGYFPSNCVAVLDRPNKSLASDRVESGAMGIMGAPYELSTPNRAWYSSNSTGSFDLSSPTLSHPQSADSCNSNGAYQFPPPSPSYRANEMTVIPENRISVCSRGSSTSTDSRTMPQSQPMPINANISNYPQRLPGNSITDPSRHSFDSRQSYHSNSSTGSLDILDEGGFCSNVNVAELYQRGMPDDDIIYTWLSDLRFEFYFENFRQAGYDIQTISRMTPEDLTAIGITKPVHRKKLKREISKLNIHDGIPDFMPATVLEWLQCLGLDVYHETLQKQQYDAIQQILEISWEDLEDIGITMLGHQKKIMLAVERLKKLNKRQSQSSCNNGRDSTPISGLMPRWSADMAVNGTYMMAGRTPNRSYSGENMSQGRESSPYSVAASKSINEIMYHRHTRHSSGGDGVPMIKPGMSRSSSGNSVNSSSDFAVPRCQSFNNHERDSTPTSSEDSGSSCGGSMHRKPSVKGPMKGIHGLNMSKHSSQDSIDQPRNSMDNVAQYATLRRTNSRKQSSQSLDFSNGVVPSPSTTSPGLGSLSSPFACFRSPYTQIHSGEVQNQLNKDSRSNSVPSSPVTKTAHSGGESAGTKKPPAPPKRTLSMKTRHCSEPANQDEEVHEFPPPPPPITFNLEAMKAHQPKNFGRLSDPNCERRPSPLMDGLKLQNVTESSLAARRRAGSSEKEAITNKNNNASSQQDSVTPTDQNQNEISMIMSVHNDSATPRNSTENIPFANDNAGTIKQKSAQLRPATNSFDGNGVGSDSALETEDCDEPDFDTVKRMPKSGGLQLFTDQAVAITAGSVSIPQLSKRKEECKTNVLTDIDTMLEDLTSELDAMLEVEEDI
ncbi:caskin-2-like isoform X2 [Watersipora subatra]|uniref:caskin-2-like isoform X2 n=1 Tax=Watersipora subatra TaxID=2589382 RepID=UPI00355B75B8